MSQLHRSLLAAAFSEMLKKFEPIVADTLETAVAVVAPAAAPVAEVVIETAKAALAPAAAPGATTSADVSAAVAALTSSPAISATPAVTPAVDLTADKNTAALAAIRAIELQMGNLATQLAAMKANLT